MKTFFIACAILYFFLLRRPYTRFASPCARIVANEFLIWYNHQGKEDR
jgi:hypothetical protein